MAEQKSPMYLDKDGQWKLRGGIPNYTKGEWKIEQPKSATLSILSSGNKPIALLQLRVPPYDDNFEQECKEMLGNAHLIAAAPRMARLLEYIVNNGWNAGVTEEAQEILSTIP